MHELIIDGGAIRKLWVAEVDRYRDHLLRLDTDSRRNRFGGAVSDDFILDYVSEAFDADSVVHGFFVDGVLRGAAELRRGASGLVENAALEAEAAFSVEPDWQSHGVGSALLERTLLVARNRGIRRLKMACLRDNRRMQQLARKFAAEISFDFGSVIGSVKAPRLTPLSLMRECVIDSQGWVSAMLDAQSRLLRPVQRA
jgi:GNAT superfamily N-acetyltransferase